MRLLFLLMPFFAFASTGNAEPNYDIVARTINFIIFAGILYYFLAEPIKKAYKERIESIDKKLRYSREKIQQAKDKEEAAKAKVIEAKNIAARFVEAGKIEAKQLSDKIIRDEQATIRLLSENHIEQKEFAYRSSFKATVQSVIEEAFSDKDIKISEQNLIELITKKVS